MNQRSEFQLSAQAVCLDGPIDEENLFHLKNSLEKDSGRRIPMHPSLGRALVALKRGSVTVGPVVRSARGGCMPPTSIVTWFTVLFARLGFEGCSSHSGRRTFITAAARNAHRTGCSLRDVQLLAGHKSIEITQGYIDGDTGGQRRLVASL